MDQFPSNSHSGKEPPKSNTQPQEEKKIDKVIVGTVTERKVPLGRRMTHAFFGGTAKSAGSYVIEGVMLPTIKDMVADMVSQGVERMLFGEIRSSQRRTYRYSGPATSGSNYSYGGRYNGPANNSPAGQPSGAWPGQPDPRQQLSPQARATHNFSEWRMDSRPEAEAVLDGLYAILSQYKVASVSDYYQLLGLTPQYTDQNYGWYDLSGSDIERVPHGYVLHLPKPTNLK